MEVHQVVYKYKEVPTVEQMEKETGVRKAFVDEFANGYKFDGAVIEDLNTTGSNGDVLDKTKAMNLIYKKWLSRSICRCS